MLDGDVVQTRCSRQIQQLARFETAENRKRAVVSNQSILEYELAECCVEKVGHGIAMQIDHEDAPARDATHLAQKVNDLFVGKVMREQRTHDVIKFRLAKRHFQRVRAN